MVLAVRKPLASAMIILVVACSLLLLNPPPAAAHAVLLETTPGNWQVLDEAPKRIEMRFNEPVDVSLADIRLIGPRGDAVEGVSRPAHPPGEAAVIAVEVPTELVNGTHTVSYRVVSADSHPATGAFTFSVRQIGGSATTAAMLDEEGAVGAVAVVYGVARWTGFAGLAGLIGTAFFAVSCWPGGADRSGTRRLFWGAWAVLVASTALGLLLYGPYASGRSMGEATDLTLLGATLGSRIGLMLALRLLLLGAIAAAVMALRRRPAGWDWAERRPLRAGLVLGVGYLLAITWSLANHSASGELTALTVPIDGVHLVAMSVWIGGLAVLLGVLLRSGDASGMRSAIPRFSRVALACIAILIVTGTYQAWRQVGTPAAMLGTSYGWFLLAKLGLVVVLLTLGAFARAWVRKNYVITVDSVTEKRRARRALADDEVRRFRRLVLVEVTLGAVVLGVTATLVSVEPARAAVAREQAAQAPARGGPVTVAVPFETSDTAAGRGQVAVSMAPGTVGKNELHLVVLDEAGRPREVAEVRATLSKPDQALGPLDVSLQYAGAGHYIAPAAELPMPGNWELAVTVRTSDVDSKVLRIPVGAT